MSDNPFLELGEPPKDGNPEAQVDYLKRMLDAFQSTGNPRIKPLRRKLEGMLVRLAERSEKAEGDKEVRAAAQAFSEEISELQRQTYELLLTVINQLRATLRVKLRGVMPPPERVDTEQLQKSLAGFSQGLRKMLGAAKKGDRQGHDEALDELDAAGKILDDTGKDLQKG